MPLLPTLLDWLSRHRSALVAYSGGVDSAVVAAAAQRALGDRALACIGISPSYPQRELRAAVQLAERLGLHHRLVPTAEHLNPLYVRNDEQRCYHCKTDLHDRLTDIARAEGWAVVLDGTNASDLGDDRPGRRAAAEHGVRSPLVELNITKPMVRALARELGLPVWDKPAMACLSSRVPHGTAVTPEVLGKIELAEDALVELGFRQFRVRHHDTLARIELPAADLPRAVELHQPIVAALRRPEIGYEHVTLDLAGFRVEPDLIDLRIPPRSDT